MKIETKYDMGQTVHLLSHGRCEKVTEPCPTCRATGEISVEGEAFVCPKCRGKKRLTADRFAWYVETTSTIGYVRVETREHDEDDPRPFEVHYMLRATGIGSGSVHREENIVGGTREDAQAEADRRNREREWPT